MHSVLVHVHCRYVPNVVEVLKYAGIQYLAAFAIVYYLLGYRLQRFLYERHILETDVIDKSALCMFQQIKTVKML